MVERARDAFGNLVLDLEDAFQRTVIAVGPQRRAGRGLHQVGADAHLPGRAADRAVEHVGAVQALRRIGLSFATELEARGAADHPQLGAARKALDDLLADAVGEELHLGFVRQVVEGEHGDHGALARRRRFSR